MRYLLVFLLTFTAAPVFAKDAAMQMPLFPNLYLGSEISLIIFLLTVALPAFVLVEEYKGNYRPISKMLLIAHLAICFLTVLNSINWILGDWYFEMSFDQEQAKQNGKYGIAFFMGKIILYSPFIGIVVAAFFGKKSLESFRDMNRLN